MRAHSSYLQCSYARVRQPQRSIFMSNVHSHLCTKSRFDRVRTQQMHLYCSVIARAHTIEPNRLFLLLLCLFYFIPHCVKFTGEWNSKLFHNVKTTTREKNCLFYFILCFRINISIGFLFVNVKWIKFCVKYEHDWSKKKRRTKESEDWIASTISKYFGNTDAILENRVHLFAQFWLNLNNFLVKFSMKTI